MEHYVTLFDSLFLPQGLALHASLQRHAGAHTLWVLCMDEAAHTVLGQLQLPNLRTIALADAETEALRQVKPGRSRGEYCWTLTPFTPGFVFDRAPDAQRVTYVDADTWLCASPQPIFRDFEASGKAVLITEHGYAPEVDQSLKSGRFCVQFITFERGRGEPVRQWWAERCTEWCFARMEPGRFGDQMYLHDWPTRFGALVHVLSQPQLTQAPWNMTRFAPGDAAFFHFHGLRLLRNRRVMLTDDYKLNRATHQFIYQPYLADLRAAVARLAAAGVVVRPQNNRPVALLRAHLWLRRLRLAWQRLRTPRYATL